MTMQTNFSVSVAFIKEEDLALAEYKNPLLTWIRLVFADDEPNANMQGIKQSEFDNLIQSMVHMPIKAKFDDGDVGGHTEAEPIGIIKEGQQEGNKIVAIGALWNDEYPEVVEYFKTRTASGEKVNFSWEIRYKDSVQDEGVEWLTGTTTKAITAVRNPAYEGRTSLVAISSVDDLINAINEELIKRGV